MLHMINKPPITANTLSSVVRIAADGDPILLIEDAVLAARPGAVTDELVKRTAAKHPVYAIAADLKARGIEKLIEGIESIGYEGFVELAEKHQVVTWN